MTQPPRETWRVEMVEQETRDGLVHFEYVLREGTREPFLRNNHRAQIRENHSRIVSGPNGGLMHVSGVEVLASDHEDFMTTDERAYRWVDKDRQGRWRDDRGRVRRPYLFPSAAWAGGGTEELDPQWQRETYTLPLAGQVDDILARYQRRAEIKGYIGDRRGTTLNLQVGASADDANEISDGTTTLTSTTFTSDASTEWFGWRFLNVTIDGTATIDDAILSVYLTSGTGGDEPGMRGEANNVDDAAVFVSGAANFNISGRANTTAEVQWDDADLGSAGGLFEEWGCSVTGGAGLTWEAVIQEVIDRAGWASGNDIALLAGGLGLGSTRDLTLDFYDTNTARAAKLDIDYTAAGGGGTAIKDIIGGGFILFPR